MKVAAAVVRLLLGLLFITAGTFSFFIAHPAPMPGLAGEFIDVFYRSHWALFVAAAQVTLGVLLLVNRFVPVALIMLAAFLYNSFAFHITMLPSTVFAPIVVLALWSLAAWPYRRLFAPIFAAKATRNCPPAAGSNV
jgi:putative oxidoreductase